MNFRERERETERVVRIGLLPNSLVFANAVRRLFTSGCSSAVCFSRS